MYGDTYSEWKDWGIDKFGQLNILEEKYFNAEIKRLPIDTKKPLKVLEIGFGNGVFLAFAKNQGWDVFGTEIDPELVSRAQAKGFKAMSADKGNSLEKNSFDLVVAFDVLEHISRDHIENMVSHLAKVLKPGGLLVARFPNGDSAIGLPHQSGDLTHVLSLGTSSVRQLATLVGLQFEFVKGAAAPLDAGSWAITAHRLVSNPLKVLINFVKNLFYFPVSPINFTSPNLIAVLSKK